MLYDLATFVVHLFAFVLSPITYIKFRIKTAFRYGPAGYTSLINIQWDKFGFIYYVIIQQTLKTYRQVLYICVIYVLYMRVHSYQL